MPDTMKAIVLEQQAGEYKPGTCWHPTPLADVPIPTAKEGEVLVQVRAAAFNHRDKFIRQSLYPGIVFSTPSQPSIMGADGAGVLVSPSSHPLYQKPVILAPSENWESSEFGPDVPGKQHGILGSVKQTNGKGTFAEYVVARANNVVALPAHLAALEGRDAWTYAAAIPLGGLTAYRAVFTKAKVEKGQNVLITGIGGGVALQALQYAVAAGANVYVTSGSEDKLNRAKKLGAKGGVSYKDPSWPKALAALLPKDRPQLDSVIDSAGGPILNQTVKLIKQGGSLVCYGQTTGKAIEMSMAAVMMNIEVKGSTMGSLKEFKEAVAFINEHKIKPVVDTVLDGLAETEKGFDLIKAGTQFGKIVIYLEQPKGKL